MRIVKLKPNKNAVHDQAILLNIARVAQNGMDFVEHERRRKIVSKLMLDAEGESFLDHQISGVKFCDQIVVEEGEWSELCRLFTGFRGFGLVDEGELADLKTRLFEAEQVKIEGEKPPSKKARAL